MTDDSRRLPITYKGTRLERHRIQTVINEWLVTQAFFGARHAGEVTDGPAKA